MKLVSLKRTKNFSSIEDLLSVEGAIRKVVIITGYIDKIMLRRLVLFVKKNRNKRIKTVVKIYLDKASSGVFTNTETKNNYLNISKRIEKFCTDDSGIYLVSYGKLFHSKCFVVESNTYKRFIIGSLNFTRKGLEDNEELVLIGESKHKRKNTTVKGCKWIENIYLPILDKKSIKLGKDSVISKQQYIRDILLNGNLYFNIEESDPFRFKLRLPKEIKNIDSSELHPILAGSITDSISVVDLIINNKKNGGLNIKLPKNKSSNLSWKKYCIETCYGLWSPIQYENYINGVIDKRKVAKKPYFERLKQQLVNNEDVIFEKFKDIVENLKESMASSHPSTKWSYYEDEKILIAWKRWYANVLNKLNNDTYFHKLVSGVSHAVVPDVWNDPVSSTEFEESFFESIIYQWSKEYNQKSKRLIAKNISEALNISDQYNIDQNEFKVLFEKWIQKTSNRSIFLVISS